jgi:hypothetical protein
MSPNLIIGSYEGGDSFIKIDSKNNQKRHKRHQKGRELCVHYPKCYKNLRISLEQKSEARSSKF